MSVIGAIRRSLRHGNAPSRLLRVLLFLSLAVVGACGDGADSARTTWRGDKVEPTPAPALTGTDWNGDPFDLAALRGKVAVVFFGYTFCPDVCPMTLAKLKQVEATLGAEDPALADDLEVVFVTVDPHRDSVAKLATYVPAFDDRFHGVHVPENDLGDLADAWNVTIQYGQPKDGPGTDSYYYVDHTGTYFVIDRQGRLTLEHPPNAKPDDLVPDLRALLQEGA